MKRLFGKEPSYFTRTLLLALVAVCLLVVGRFTNWLEPVREKADLVALPFYWVTDMPNRVSDWFGDTVVSRSELLARNEALENANRILESRLQRLAGLRAENVQLRQLLNSSKLVEERILVAEMVGVSPDPGSHKVIINKGLGDGIYVGQPVLDAYGLMGQVVSVTAFSAQVLLITDNAHAIPVQVARNNVRTIADGTGDLFRMKLRYVSAVMDIKQGDLLVSSGLGSRFPVGYPVAQVESIQFLPGEPFATVYARPAAQLDRTRHVLLVFSKKPDP